MMGNILRVRRLEIHKIIALILILLSLNQIISINVLRDTSGKYKEEGILNANGSKGENNYKEYYNSSDSIISSSEFNNFGNDYNNYNDYNDYIDGILNVSYSGETKTGQNITLYNNISSAIIGAKINVNDINDTQNFVKNGDFNQSIDGWTATNDYDVHAGWLNEYNMSYGAAQLNLTGLEQPHKYTICNYTNDTDYFPDVGLWQFEKNDSDSFYTANISYDANNYGVSSGYGIDLAWNWNGTGVTQAANEGQRIGYAFRNFTYKGTSHLVNAHLSFYYKLQFGGDFYNDSYGNLNISVYITDPNNNTYQIGNWIKNYNTTEAKANGYNSYWHYKSFNVDDLKDIISEKGNYTLKFKAMHYHHNCYPGLKIVQSRVLIDDVKLVLNYSMKEFENGDNESLNYHFDFNRLPRENSTLNMSYLITEPTPQMNSSGSYIFLKINNETLYKNNISETQPNHWMNISLQVDLQKINISSGIISISVGVHFILNQTLVFYPNTSWSLLLDNVSFIIKSTPQPQDINLSIIDPIFKQVYGIRNKFDNNVSYGAGYGLIKNYSIFNIYNGFNMYFLNSPYLRGLNRTLYFNSSVPNTDISYNITIFYLSWRDILYREFKVITNMTITYLNNIYSLINNTDFGWDDLYNFKTLLNYSKDANFDKAIAEASRIGNEFGFLYRTLLNELNSSFYQNRYNPHANFKYFNNNSLLSLLSLNNYNDLKSLFTNIWNTYGEFFGTNNNIKVIKDKYNILYKEYAIMAQNKLSDIKERLRSMRFTEESGNPSSSSNFSNSSQTYLDPNICILYNSITQIYKEVSNAFNGLSLSINFDVNNYINDWNTSENMDSLRGLTDDNGFSGIYIGNLPVLLDMLIALKNFSKSNYNAYMKHSTFFEFLMENITKYINTDTKEQNPPDIADANYFNYINDLSPSERAYYYENLKNAIPFTFNPFPTFGEPAIDRLYSKNESAPMYTFSNIYYDGLPASTTSEHQNDHVITNIEENSYRFQLKTTALNFNELRDYLLLLFIVEDAMARPNLPKLLDYSYNSILNTIQKTAINNSFYSSYQDSHDYKDLPDFIQTNYTAEIQFQTANIKIITENDNYNSTDTDSITSPYYDIYIKNLGNSSKVFLKQRYYLSSSNGYILISEQYKQLFGELENNKSINCRVPITLPDSQLIKTLFIPQSKFSEISNNYILKNEIYFGEKLVASNQMSVTFLKTSSEKDYLGADFGLYSNIHNKVLFAQSHIQFQLNEDFFNYSWSHVIYPDDNYSASTDNHRKLNYVLNISKILDENDIPLENLTKNPYNNIFSGENLNNFESGPIITIIIRNELQSTYKYNSIYTLGINDYIFYINRTNINNPYQNNISGLNLHYSDDYGDIILTFNLKEILINTGLMQTNEEITTDLIKKFLNFNISYINPQDSLSYKVYIFISKQLGYTPFILKDINYLLETNDQSSGLKISIPFIELSGLEYFSIDDVRLLLDRRSFYSTHYIYYNPYNQIQNELLNAYLIVYPHKLENNSLLSLTLELHVSLYNNTKYTLKSQLYIHILSYNRLQEAIRPNLIVANIIGLIGLLSVIYIRRFFKRNHKILMKINIRKKKRRF
ncbi:MAG: hypothetical protein ACTSU2_01290 [Promethearchaeota archaeon]